MFDESTSNRLWICCQIGAREHYAIPRALRQRGLCAGVVTDYWAKGRFESFLPASSRKTLATRFHPDLLDGNVIGLNGGFLQLEVAARFQKRSGWDLITQRNHWFQKTAAQKVRSMIESSDRRSPPAVFAFSYAAKQIFEAAKRLDCPTILGQIDPGPFETRLVQELHLRHGLTPLATPPESYWEQWRVECELADCIIVNSNWSRQALINEGIPEQKISVVPLAYEVSADIAENRIEIPVRFSKERPLEILFLGQMIARKGVIELTEAIGELSDRPVRWTMVGGGDHELLARLRQLSNVTVTGQVDRKAAIKYYQTADLFILPTHSDGYAITLLEAAAFGLPIIASPFCGEVVRDGVDGITIPEVTSAAIVDSVISLIETPATLQKFCNNQRKRKFRTIDDLSFDLFNINQRI